MRATKFGQNFFDSTRGQVLKLLRRGINTVDDLATGLEVSNNAVRAHLTTLERDGLVERKGMQPGFRKPHVNYQLSAEAEQLFPKAYPALFNQLLEVLKERLKPEELESILVEVARSLAEGDSPGKDESIENRVQRAIAALESMGGASAFIEEDGKSYIRCITRCPFDVSVSKHPELCDLAETFVSKITGLRVKERCQKGEFPKCSFEIRNGKK